MYLLVLLILLLITSIGATTKYFFMSAQTFAEAFKKAVSHWKTEVTGSFLVFILRCLLNRYKIDEDEFAEDLELRFSTVRFQYFYQTPSCGRPFFY
jgi:hypothetical protein